MDLPQARVDVPGNRFGFAVQNAAIAGDSPEHFTFEPPWAGRPAGTLLTGLVGGVWPALIRAGRWRPTFHLHVDRASDGWNKHTFGLLPLAVALRSAPLCRVSAMLVGHNHVLVDRRQREHQVRIHQGPDPGQLGPNEALDKARGFGGGHTASILGAAAGFSAWLEGHLGPELGGLTGKSKVLPELRGQGCWAAW